MGKIPIYAHLAIIIIAKVCQCAILMPVRKTELPKREIEICRRLREARERLGVAQGECAKQLGLERSTLVNYEIARTPLRVNVALRFCRQFIVSEEWLATGKFDACYLQAKRHGILGIGTGRGAVKLETEIFSRQCVDLLSEPSTLHIPTGLLFSEAYDKFLKEQYTRLVSEFFFLPRIWLSDADNWELGINLLNAINRRFICLLENEALRRGKKPSDAWRVYVRHVFESSDVIFRRMMRLKSNDAHMENLQWIRAITNDANMFIPFIGESVPQTERVKASEISVLN